MNDTVKPNNHIGHYIFKSMKEHSDLLFQIDVATHQEETYESVLNRSIKLAKSLRKLGLKPGDTVAFGGFKHLDINIPFYSALFNGHPVIGVDPYFKYDEIKALFKIVVPKVAFCDEETYDTYLKVTKDLELDTKIVAFGNGENSLKKFVESYGDDETDNFTVAEFDTNSVYVFLITTSGTTGNVKVAAFKHGAVYRKMVEYTSIKGFNFKTTTILNLPPVNWVSSSFISLASPLLGQCLVQTSVPDDLDIIVEMINKHKPVYTLAAPSLAAALLKRSNEVDFTCFLYIILTGSKVYPEVLTEFQSLMRKGAFVFESYGQTETLGPILQNLPDAPRGSCGKSYPTHDIKLIDTETGNEITEPNVPGELWVKGPAMTEYYNDPQETAKAFTEDGYFKTGDLLYRDENNNYYFVERIKTLIKCRNFHVLPTELEDVIRSHPDVIDVCVIGIEDPEDSERPVACVVLREGAEVTAKEIKQLVSDKLSKQKELRGGVVFLRELPRTSTGKIARKKLLHIVLQSTRD
ncbi:unnamed protein product [Leptosia nina]|uniref:Luciferin 4-monooxygenase n=1 Tax=Leptosia nina TaxID=320188 RepID=A0AAV1IX25_9NEOP